MRRWAWMAAAAVALSALALAGGCPRKSDGKLRVAATIFPLADMAKQIGGDRVDVTCIVPPGVSPHGFEPLTQQTRSALADARLVVSAGITDAWLKPAMIPSGARHVRLADFAGTVGTPEPVAVTESAPATQPALPAAEEHAEHGNHHDEDPHYWLDPRVMAVAAERVGEALAELDPAGAGEYRQRAAQYAAECRRLVEDMRREAAAFRHKVFIAQHPAYSVMAEAMGLRQVGAIEPVAGIAASPGHIEELVNQITELGVPAIFAEPQLPPRDAEALSRAAAARGHPVKVLQLDAEGNPSTPGRDSYLANMRANLAALKEGLHD